MLEVVTATMLSICALLATIFGTDMVLTNGKKSGNNGRDSKRTDLDEYRRIMDEIDYKQSKATNVEKRPPAMPPERHYNSTEETVSDYKMIMAALEMENNGKKKAPYESKNK